MEANDVLLVNEMTHLLAARPWPGADEDVSWLWLIDCATGFVVYVDNVVQLCQHLSFVLPVSATLPWISVS